MHAKNKFVCLIAVLLAAFAVSANAAKTITLTNSTTGSQPAFLGATLATGTVYVQLNNTGNSNASSLELDWSDTPQFTVNSATINTSKGPVTVAPAAGQTPGGYKGVVFTFTLPQKSSVVIALNVTVGAGATCGASQITWQPYAWTGGVGTPSTSFSQPALGTYKSNLPGAPNCTLTFTTQPADAFVSSIITTVPFNSFGAPVKVLALQGASPVSSVSVSIGSTGGACSISGSATTGADGTAALTSISSSAAGMDCQLTATATGFTSEPSNAFDVEAPLSTLDCAPANGSTFGGLASLFISPTSSTIPPAAPTADWGLLRGINRDNTCTFKIPFTFTFDGPNSALFTEDSLGQQTSVEYIIRWAPVDVDGDKWSAKQPCVSWGVTDHSPLVYQVDGDGVCVGDYVPALACLADDANAPGDGAGEVMPLIPTAYPFNDAVESGYSQYQPNVRAKVCVSQQGWTSYNGQVQYWHKLIDQSDTGIRLP
jgi:hypothetical protein